MLCANVVIAQNNIPFKNSDVTTVDFSYTIFQVDTSSGAVILSDAVSISSILGKYEAEYTCAKNSITNFRRL